ncbi:MAG: Trk system potassium transporter TrkA [Candidatus Delongbacteria bacterium]|nr:Trk system potassium transporter TrkA [Candidatus Delongbacteria bacterium]MBN2836520.1 Trk system potassium transporter TrkA [Candidatus Delongbacteria bacterium]
MNIVIFGAGRTGEYLTRIFVYENNNVIVVDKDPEKCAKIEGVYDVSTLVYDGIKKEMFNKKFFSNTDLFIAVTAVDEMNIIACGLAKEMGDNTMTVARIRNEDYEMFGDFTNTAMKGIDLIIHPEKELTKELVNLVSYPEALDIYDLSRGNLFIISTLVKRNSSFDGVKVNKIARNVMDMDNYRIVLIERKMEAIIPNGDFEIKENDKIYFISEKENIETFFHGMGYNIKAGKDIMINGSGNVTKAIGLELEKLGKFNVKVIVNDKEKALALSELFKNTLVVFGEATDIDVLATEGIDDMDFYLALTGNDEANMVSSLLASHLEVKRTVTRIEKTDYLPITRTIGLGRCVNSSIATTNAIMRFVKHGKILSTSTFKGINIGAVTFKIGDNSKCTNKAISELKFPEKAVIGAILRGDEYFVPSGNHIIKPDDEIILFCERIMIPKFEKMFGR